MTDKRANSYIADYGTKSWELDALQPSVIERLVRDEIEGMVDFDVWRETKQEELEGREALAKLHGNWPAVREFLADLRP